MFPSKPTMFPSKPHATEEMPHFRPDVQRSTHNLFQSSSPAEMPGSHGTNWGDANGQVDYFVSAGFNRASMYSTALTPGGSQISISPIKRSGKAASIYRPTEQHTSYPSQELNHRYVGLGQISPPEISDSAKLPPLPPPLPPPRSGSIGSYSNSNSLETLSSLAAKLEKRTVPEEVTSSMSTGLTQDLDHLSTHMHGGEHGFPGYNHPNVLDSFDIYSVGSDYEEGTGQPKTEGLDEYGSDDNPAQAKVSNSAATPRAKAKQTKRKRASKPRKTKGSPKKIGGIKKNQITTVDILKGRGGLTNRNPGNMRFRDEARDMRAAYRDADTTRHDKFLMSQQLVCKVKAYGGRFLEKGDDNLWHLLDEKDARKKASQVLREEKWE